MWVALGVREEEGRHGQVYTSPGRKETLIVGAFPPKSLPKRNPARAETVKYQAEREGSENQAQ